MYDESGQGDMRGPCGEGRREGQGERIVVGVREKGCGKQEESVYWKI